MILRRLSLHVRKQNWLAVGLDLFIVVLGIFLGFQVTAWNEARQDDLRGEDYTRRLVVEFDQQVEGINRRIEALHRIESDTKAFRQWQLDAQQKPNNNTQEPAVLRAWIDRLTTMIPPQPDSTLYAQLVAAGELSLLADQVILALIDYHKMSLHAAQGWDFSIQEVSAQKPLLRRHLRIHGEGEKVSTWHYEIIDVEKLIADPDANFALEVILEGHMNLLQVYDRQRRTAKTVQQVLANQLQTIETQ